LFAANFIALGTGLSPHRQDRPFRMLLQCDHCTIPSNKAEPMRACATAGFSQWCPGFSGIVGGLDLAGKQTKAYVGLEENACVSIHDRFSLLCACGGVG
jgi:hypothetical protein